MRLVQLAKIVIHKVQRDGVRVVLNLLRERVGQPCEPAHMHPNLPSRGPQREGVNPDTPQRNLPLPLYRARLMVIDSFRGNYV